MANLVYIGDSNGVIYATISSKDGSRRLYFQHYINNELTEDEEYDTENLIDNGDVTIIGTRNTGHAVYTYYAINTFPTFENLYAICYQGDTNRELNLYGISYKMYNQTIPISMESSGETNVEIVGTATVEDYKYQIASNQYNLTDETQLLTNVSAYGKNGNVTGDGSIETPDNTFTDISAQLYCNIQKQYDNMEPIILTDENKIVDTGMYLIPVKLDGTPLLDTSNVTNMRYMFRDCTLLTAIPQLNTSNVTDMSSMFNRCTSLTTIPQLDTSNVTKMNSMFYGCSSLTAIPQLNTSNVTGVSYTFLGCDSLSNDSLNNILAMLTNAIKITSNKTLKYVGLSEAQATTCTTLSNWSACETAGWTTGY